MTSLIDAWRAKIPGHWDWVKLSRVASLGTGHTPDRNNAAYWLDCSIPWVTAADLSGRVDAFAPLMSTGQQISELGLANSAAVLHPAGTVMFCRTASVGLFCITGREMATTQAFVTWTPSSELDGRFLLYVIAAMGPEFDRLAYGSTHLTIYMPDLEALRIPLPPIEEQRRIADFLDDQVARMDGLIAARDAQLSALQSATLAAAHESVLGASTTARKASTLAWADSVPQHWSEVQLRLVAKIGTGHTPSRSEPDYWIDCDIPWLTTTDVKRFRRDQIDAISDTMVEINGLGLDNSAAVMHPAGTVGLCRTSASAGFSIVMDRAMATSQDFVTWTPGKHLRSHYLLWCLRAMRRDLLDRLAMGSTHKTIYFPDLEGIRIPLPSLEEQDRAIAEIRSKVAGVRHALEAVEGSIALLQERKSALITAAVTGDFDVMTASGGM